MSYATSADIESEFKNLDFDASGAKVTAAEVTEFITQESNIIDMRLSNRYETPITGTASLSILKKITIDCVAYRVAKILNLKKELPLPDESIKQDMNYASACRQSKKLLDDIFEGIVILQDAELKLSGTGVASYNVDNNILPVFERDTDQW